MSADLDKLVAENVWLRARVGELERIDATRQATIATLEGTVARLTAALDETRRAGKRQAAPFRKAGGRVAAPKKAGRKSGDEHGPHAHRAILMAGVRQSMSRAANCYDNAFLESCFGTIETELEMTEYQDSLVALQDLASYVAYYNLRRRHSSLDYLSPAAFEDRQARPS